MTIAYSRSKPKPGPKPESVSAEWLLARRPQLDVPGLAAFYGCDVMTLAGAINRLLIEYKRAWREAPDDETAIATCGAIWRAAIAAYATTSPTVSHALEECLPGACLPKLYYPEYFAEDTT
ncbi:MAG: hypothetical protein M9930_19025 [Anaerolineae bacterium]|nr:hypothetical protein [Anaerolineae bacterium]